MNSTEMIGWVQERFKELSHHKFDWRSFYNGWLEGRADMLSVQTPFQKRWKKMLKTPFAGKFDLEKEIERAKSLRIQMYSSIPNPT